MKIFALKGVDMVWNISNGALAELNRNQKGEQGPPRAIGGSFIVVLVVWKTTEASTGPQGALFLLLGSAPHTAMSLYFTAPFR